MINRIYFNLDLSKDFHIIGLIIKCINELQSIISIKHNEIFFNLYSDSFIL